MHNKYFNIGTFAKACGVTKATLMHYENIGLFKADYIDQNGYRFYGEDQIYKFEAISLLRNMDMPLAEIISFFEANSSEKNLELLKSNRKIIQDKIIKFEQINKLLDTTIRNMEMESSIETNNPFFEYQENPSYLFLFKTTKRDGSITENLPELRHYLTSNRSKFLVLNNSVGELVLNKDIVNDTFNKSYGCYQLKKKIDDPMCYERPRGVYLSMYYREHSNHIPYGYSMLKEYCNSIGCTIINNAYEIDYSTVISEQDRSKFILKLSFQLDESSFSLEDIIRMQRI